MQSQNKNMSSSSPSSTTSSKRKHDNSASGAPERFAAVQSTATRTLGAWNVREEHQDKEEEEDSVEKAMCRQSLVAQLHSRLAILFRAEGIINSSPPWGLLERWMMVCKLGSPFQEDPLIPSGIRNTSGNRGPLFFETEALSSAESAGEICKSMADEASSCAKVMSIHFRNNPCKRMRGTHTQEHHRRHCMPIVKKRDIGRLQVLKLCGQELRLSTMRYDRLKRIYEQSNDVRLSKHDDREAYDIFLRRLWLMLMRYKTAQGLGYQMALPDACFRVLRDDFGVTHECFASPLNCFFDTSYGSAFPDTDRFFGSSPPFMQRSFDTGGSFEVNPPFVEEILAAVALRIIECLQKVDTTALSFVVIMPMWKDTPAFATLTKSPFARRVLEFAKHKHIYRPGNQHTKPTTIEKPAGAGSLVVFMQNDNAAQKWPCSNEAIGRFISAFSAS